MHKYDTFNSNKVKFKVSITSRHASTRLLFDAWNIYELLKTMQCS